MNDTSNRPERVPVKTTAPSLSTNEPTIKLHQEKLVVRKRETDTGVTIRKVVRSKMVTVSVELLFEELVMDDSSAGQTATENQGPPQEEFITIPLYREELVIEKKIVLAEEVHIGKRSFTEKKVYSAPLLSENIELLVRGTSENTDAIP